VNLIEAAENITRENGVHMWTGPQECTECLRNTLWAHWEKCAGQPITGSHPVNMHDDPRCVDRRYLTTDPENWTAPVKRNKE